MSIIAKAANAYYTYRFLRILTTPWEETKAYELGIVDKDGKVLKKYRQLKRPEERKAYTLFHRLAFNIKRILNKIPMGRSRLASYAAALFLLKEETGMTDTQVSMVLEKVGVDTDEIGMVNESNTSGGLSPGVYSLVNGIAFPSTGEVIARSGSLVSVDEGLKPMGRILGIPVYEVTHIPTQRGIYITQMDLDPINESAPLNSVAGGGIDFAPTGKAVIRKLDRRSKWDIHKMYKRSLGLHGLLKDKR